MFRKRNHICLFSPVSCVRYADGGWRTQASDIFRGAHLWCADALLGHCLHLRQSPLSLWLQELDILGLSFSLFNLYRWESFKI